MSGVHGAVGELGSVPAEYATACETAAGGRLANVVVDDDQVGSDCIDYLKRRNAGRATFLPITEMDDRGLPRLPNDPGVVDFARNVVEYDAEYEGIFSYVLGSTLVVEDMDTARSLMGDYRMVTLDGDLVEKSGAMTGGSGGGSRYSFSKSGKGRLERLAEEISTLEDERQSLTASVREAESKLDDARDRKQAASEQVASIEREIESKEDDLAGLDDEIESLEARLDDLRGERGDVDEQMQAVEETIAETEADIEAVEAEIDDLEAELADSRVPELTNRKEEIQADVEAQEERMDDLDARLNELQLEKQYTEEAVDDLHETVRLRQSLALFEQAGHLDDRPRQRREADIPVVLSAEGEDGHEWEAVGSARGT